MTDTRPYRVSRTDCWAVVFLCLTLVGCTTVEDSPPQRWIPEDPQDTFSAERFDSRQEVFRWSFLDEAALDAWHFHDVGNESGLTNEGLVVRSSTGDPQLYRRLAVAAENVDVVRVAVAGLDQGEIQLFWAGSAEPFQAAKSIRLAPDEVADRSSEFKIFEFRVGEHPEWAGQIGRLRLDPTSIPGERVVVRWLAGESEGLSQDEVRELTARPWKVALGNDHRNAVLSVPGRPHERTIKVPADGRLRFEYGTVCATRSAFSQFAPVRLEVLLQRPDRDPDVVWEVRMEDDHADRALQWNEETIDLGAHSGSEATISIRTTAATGPSKRPACVVALGNPEVTSSAFEQRGPNVILISIDTLRADRLSLYGYERKTSPNLDNWARRSAAVFRSAVVQAPWTLPSHVSMLTGVEAYRHGVHFYEMTIPRSLTFLAEILRKAGYSTMAVTGGGLLHPRYEFTQGFDHYWYYPGSRATGEELSQGMERALEWLEEPPGHPFFLFIHTYEVHTPWRSRQPYFDRFSDLPAVQDMRMKNDDPDPEEGFLAKSGVSALNLVRPKLPVGPTEAELVELANAAYDSGVAYTDEQLGRLFDVLARHELDDDTIVVVTSDHGELLGEYDVVGHRYLYEENILVPLIIAAPGGRGAGLEIDSQVRSIDIVPTVLELAGLQALEDVDGESLVPLLDGSDRDVRRQAWTYSPGSNHGIAVRVDGRFKYVFNDTAWPQLHGTEAIYALQPIAQEDRNILSSFERIERLRAAVRKRVAVAPGLRLRFVTGPERVIRGHLRGPAVSPNGVKSLHIPCACLRYDPSGVNFDVPEGQDFTVVVQGSGSEPSTLVLEGAEGAPRGRFRHRIRPVGSGSAIGERRIIALTNAGWRDVRPPVEFDTFVEIWWEGAFATSPESSLGGDENLMEQLRALGYVD